MSTKPTTITADLQALADEIARDTGCTPAEALAQASQQRGGLRLFAARWNAMARRSRCATVPQKRREHPEAPDPRDQE